VLKTVRARLVLLMLVAALPAAGLAVWAYLDARRAVLMRVRAEALGLARLAANTQDQVALGVRQFLVALAQFPAVQGRDGPACDALFARLRSQSPAYSGLAAVDTEGRGFCSSPPSPGPVNLADREYFRAALETRRFAVSGYTVGRITGEPVILFAYPALDGAGEPRGVVVASMSLRWLNQVLARTPLPDGAAVTLFDRKGTVLGRHPQGEALVGRAAGDHPAGRMALAGHTATVELEAHGLDGVRRFYALVSPGQDAPAGLHVAVGLSPETLLGPERLVLARNLLVLALVSALALASAWILGGRLILRRVRALARAMAHLAAGDRAARVAADGGTDELAQLARGFNRMADAEQARLGELELAVEALRQSEERFRLLVDRVQDYAIFMLDTGGRVVTWNAGAERLKGYRADEVVGQHFARFYPPDEAARGLPDEHLAAAARDGRREYEGWRVRKDGSRFQAAVVLTALADPAGRPVGFAKVTRDVTRDRQQAKDRFRLVVESIPSALVVADRTGTILLVNGETERLFGYAREELIGQPVEVLVPERARAQHPGHRAAFFGEPRARAMGTGRDLHGRRKDGGEFPTEVTLNPILTDEGVLVLAAVVDITERKRAEALRQASLQEETRRIQEVSRLKSEFLASMSHELRTPLNGIIGFTELMHDGKVGPVSPEHQEYLSDVLASARHLLRLINDILDLAKVESGKLEFRPEPVDVGRAVAEVRDILRALAASHRVRVETRVDPDLGPVVLDPAKLKQVLYNYLSNALKFTPDEGRVTVRVEPEGPDHFRLEVEDTGIGIPPEALSRLFTEFAQADGPLPGRARGTGLGLALTKRLVEAQGGRVGVESAPGRGSRFFALLPRRAAAAAGGAEPAPAVPGPRGGPAVLVVEDDPRDRAWLVRTLADAGYAVETAATGAEAVARCRERAFDAIALDLLLPDMSGHDVLAAVRADSRNRGVPVLVVTVVAEHEAAAGFPMADYLVKPVDALELLAALRGAGVPPESRQTILIVDDDPAVLKLMDVALAERGYRPVCAASAADGLRAAELEPPAAVVLDLLMPGMDGFDFLDRYRRTAAGRRTPVIVWTVKDLTADDHARLAGTVQRVVRKGHGAGPLLQELGAVVGAAAARPGHDP
jgi:PAS domain S-box-containing protein